jgi:hypothetical protein
MELAILVQPSQTTQPATVFAVQPAVELRSAGAAVPRANVSVQASIQSGGGALGGTTTVLTNGSGRAQFTNLALSGTAGPSVLRFSVPAYSSVPSVSSSQITLVGANQLAILNPSLGPAFSDIPFFKSPSIQLRNANGPVAQSGVLVDAAKASGSGALTGVISAVTDGAGVATFHDLRIAGSGSHTISFTALGAQSVTSSPIQVAPVLNTTVANAESVGPLTGSQDSVRYFSVTVPANAVSLRFDLYGGSGDADLYASRNRYPTQLSADCRSFTMSNVESCAMNGSLSGTWNIAVHGFTAYQNAFVKATYYDASCSQLTLILGATVNGSIAPGDCTSPTLRDRYAITFSAPQVVKFTLTGDASQRLEIKDQTASRAFYFGSTIIVTSPLLVGVGTMAFDVASPNSVNFPYTFLAESASGDLSACGDVFAWAGANATLTLQNTDCAGSVAGRYADRIVVFLGGGQTLAVGMSAGFDALLNLFTGSGSGVNTGIPLKSDNNSGGGTNSLLTYTNTNLTGAIEVLTIEATSFLAGQVGPYTLTVSMSPPYSNVLSPEMSESTPGRSSKLVPLGKP